MFSLFGWWVAWVYALSLALPVVLPKAGGPANPRLRDWSAEVRFSSAGFSVVESDVNGLLGLKATLTAPAPIAIEVPVEVRPATAEEGRDYRVSPMGTTVLFEKGSSEGRLRLVRGHGPDVTPIDDESWRGPRSLRLRLLGNSRVFAAGDASSCTVTIEDDEPTPKDLTPLRFVSSEVATTERKLAGLEIEAEAGAPVSQQTPLEFQLFKTGTAGRQAVTTFQRRLAPGERRVVFRLEDVLDSEEQRRLGVADDARPGADESYELVMRAPAPLYPVDPGVCRILVADDDEPPQVRPLYFDTAGREIPYLDPAGGMTVELMGEPLETESLYELSVDGREVSESVVVPAGKRRGNVVPLERCGLGACRGRRCSVNLQCRAGGCRGQRGVSERALVDAPVPGDALVVLVNNGRLHERGDRIVEQVRAAIATGTNGLYGDAVQILNREGEDRMTAQGGGPDPDKAYRPFEQAGEDVADQLKRVEEFVARKRESAAREDLRAVVIWPERDLGAGEGLAPVEGGAAPISFLLPDADPSSTHELRRALVPREAPPGSVTVRAPAASELKEHIENLLGNAAETASASGFVPSAAIDGDENEVVPIDEFATFIPPTVARRRAAPDLLDPEHPVGPRTSGTSPATSGEPILEQVPLPPPSAADGIVDRFIQYDLGKLPGDEGVKARDEFAALGPEAVGPLIRGLNKAATIGYSCPIVVLNSKLTKCLTDAVDPRLDVMAATNLCSGVPRNAPHYRTAAALRDWCIARLGPEHPLRRRKERVDVLLAQKDDSAIDRALKAGDPDQRLAAVTAAGSMGPRFGRELIAALGDEDPAVRSEAHQELLALGKDVDFGPREPAGEDDRRAAIASWNRWYEQQVQFSLPPEAWRATLATVRSALKKPGEQTRLTAVLAARYRHLPMAAEFITLLSDNSPAVRREAHRALVELANGTDLGPEDLSDAAAVEAAVGRWRHWHGRRLRLTRNSAKNDARIIEEMTSPDDEIRLAAVSTAARRGLPSAGLFVDRLSDQMPEIQQAARQGLVHLAGGDDHGPSETADAAAKAVAIERWRAWLTTHAERRGQPAATKSPDPSPGDGGPDATTDASADSSRVEP
jgi:hypothetical protein